MDADCPFVNSAAVAPARKRQKQPQPDDIRVPISRVSQRPNLSAVDPPTCDKGVRLLADNAARDEEADEDFGDPSGDEYVVPPDCTRLSTDEPVVNNGHDMKVEEVDASGLSEHLPGYCTACRVQVDVSDFLDGQKLCHRHQQHQQPSPTDYPLPELTSPNDLRLLLRAASDLDGVRKFECAISLEALPGQEEVQKEINGVPSAAVLKAKKRTQSDVAESMRITRARCRPLINLIHEATGYSFIYKDCRTGRKHKYAHSLRYLCSQRSDQDGTKRRTAANALARQVDEQREQVESLNVTVAAFNANVAYPTLGRGDGDDNLDLSCNFDSLDGSPGLSTTGDEIDPLRKAIAGPSSGIAKGMDRMNEEDEDEDDGPTFDQELQSAMSNQKLGISGLMHEYDDAGATLMEAVEGSDDDRATGADMQGGSNVGDMLNQLLAFDAGDGALLTAGRMDPTVGPEQVQKKKTGKGWRKGTGKPKPAPPAIKPERKKYSMTREIKKMERFDCRGTLVVNISADGTTTFISILHNLHHVDYVDVVGNRLRGAANVVVAQPSLVNSMLPPIGSTEIEGDTHYESAASTFRAMLDLLELLQGKTSRGEQSVVKTIYDMTQDLREYRVSVMEAMVKGAKGGKIKKEKAALTGARKRKATGVKRAILEVSVLEEDEESADQLAAAASVAGSSEMVDIQNGFDFHLDPSDSHLHDALSQQHLDEAIYAAARPFLLPEQLSSYLGPDIDAGHDSIDAHSVDGSTEAWLDPSLLL